MVGMTGFEPATPCSRSKCTTKLCYIPIRHIIILLKLFCKFAMIVWHGDLAQLGEHFLDVEGVRGSSPLASTIKCYMTADRAVFCFQRRGSMKYLVDFVALALIYGFVFFKKWKNKGKDVLFVNTLMYIYLSFVLYFTLMPIITSIPSILNHTYVPMNLVPFIDVLEGRGHYFREVILNIIMTIPFGFLFPLTRNRIAKFGTTVFFCFLMSLGIELLQPLINDFRTSDVTDLITNVFGGMIGYGLYVVFRPLTFEILNRLKRLT